MNAITEAPIATVPEPEPETHSLPEWWWKAAVVAGLIAFLYYAILGRLTQEWWNDPNFSHGFFVPLFSAYVVWQSMDKLRAIAVRPAWSGLLVIALALATLVVGTLGAELFLSRSSFVLLLGGLVIYFLGWAHFRALFFPWIFLIAMVPLPSIIFNQITFPLQFLASKFASTTLPWAGVPVLREGNIIQLPIMQLEVAEACSGIRSLISLGTLAIIYGYFLEKEVWKRVVLALAAIPIAVVANGMRIFGTGLCVQYWDPQKAEGFFHSFSGWIIFIVSIFLLLLVHRVMSLSDRMLRKAE
jgi:exosortase